MDHSNDGFKVFETAAIFVYLASHYDKDHKFSFEAGNNDESEALQWMFFFVSVWSSLGIWYSPEAA